MIVRRLRPERIRAGVVAAFGSVWVANDGGTLVRIDPRTNRVRKRIRVGAGACFMTADARRPLDRELQGRPRPRSLPDGRVKRIAVGASPGQRARRFRAGLGDDLGRRQARGRRPADTQGRPPDRRRPAARPASPRGTAPSGSASPGTATAIARVSPRPVRVDRIDVGVPRAEGVRGGERKTSGSKRTTGDLLPLRSRREARPRSPRGRADARHGSRRPGRDDLDSRQGTEHRLPGRSRRPARARLVPGRPGRLRRAARLRARCG